MASLSDVGVSAAINIAIAVAFLVTFAFLRLQPVNDRVYYPKWYIKRLRHDNNVGHPRSVSAIINLDWKVYLHFLDWTREALRMPEPELIEHAGFDSAIFLRIHLLGLKLFVPIFILGAFVLAPINGTGQSLEDERKLLFSDIDKLSISNVADGSQRLWAHVTLAYVFTAWICGTLYKEYKKVMLMRVRYHDAQKRRPDHFTVLVKNIPADPDESFSLHVERFFRVNHPDYYLTHQIVRNTNQLMKLVNKKEGIQNWVDFYRIKHFKNPNVRPTIKRGFLGLWGSQVDAIDHYEAELQKITDEISIERARVIKDPKALLPVAFVSFKGRWGAAVAAQTQQTKNPTVWLTEWAPEPHDVYWRNLAIPFVELTIRKLVIAIAMFFLVVFYMIPITIVQTLANLEGLSRTLPFLKPVLQLHVVSSILQGFLPGLALKVFLMFLPTLLMLMSKIEGYTSLSTLERRSASKYFIFMVVAVFFGNILSGTASEQLNQFIHETPTDIPNLIGDSVGQKALFFVTYIMVDGWAGIAGEILRVQPLIVYHLKTTFLVKTDKDRDKAMDPGGILLDQTLPRIELYFLLGIVYAAIAPILLPFIIIYFGFAFFVYRHQVINVYDQQYESAGAFWPHLNTRIIACLLLGQIVLMGVLATKNAKNSTPILLLLPVLTIAFHNYCKNRFEPAFRKYPLEEAMAKDTVERAMEPHLDLKNYLQDTYMHPVFKDQEGEEEHGTDKWTEDPPLVRVKRGSRDNTPAASSTTTDIIMIASQST